MLVDVEKIDVFYNINYREKMFASRMFTYILQVLFLTSQGGHDSGDCLRRIMKRIGTNHLWSQYSLRGQKQKRSFQQHPICKIAISM